MMRSGCAAIAPRDHLLCRQQRKLAGLGGERLSELFARVGHGGNSLSQCGQQRCGLDPGTLEPVGVASRMAVGSGLLANRIGICVGVGHHLSRSAIDQSRALELLKRVAADGLSGHRVVGVD